MPCLEQTEIARRLGISNTTMRKIAYAAKLKWTLLNNKRHYDWDKFVKVIKEAKCD